LLIGHHFSPPGDLTAIGNDIRGALLQEVASKSVIMPAGETILPSAEAFHRLRMEREEIRTLRLARAAGPKDAKDGAMPPAGEGVQLYSSQN
jgi:hypothetical protein